MWDYVLQIPPPQVMTFPSSPEHITTHNPNSLNLYPHTMIIPTVFISPPSATDQMTQPEFL